ncbi:MAG: hypothetical protein KKF56_03770 [Nanoarchaeota archaeon]|nr:hypothetical protein [Nanoarchaeota archaeon]
MKILYGLAGEGFGHSSRAKAIIPYLEKRGHKVKVVTYGQAVDVLKKEKYDVFEIKGCEFVFEKGRLKKSKTLYKSWNNFFDNIKKSKEIYDLMLEDFDLLISDMEPLVSILSNWYRLPLLSLDNQHRLTNLDLNVPEEYKIDFEMARFVVNLFCRSADWYIIVNFANSKVNKKWKEITFQVPPIIRPDVRKLKPKKKDYVLVYLSKKDRKIVNLLKKIDDNFVVYGMDKEGKEGNIVYHKKGFGFVNDLKDCKAIVASAGFSLIAEALYLNKPYFALPLKGQFEQMLNAIELRGAGFGDYSVGLKNREVEDFLSDLKKYEIKLKKYKPDYDLLFKKLDVVIRKVKNNKS